MSLVLNGVCDTAEKLLAGGCYWLEHSPLRAPFWASSLIQYLPENSDLLSFKPLIKDQQPHSALRCMQISLSSRLTRNMKKPTILRHQAPEQHPWRPSWGVALLGVSLACFSGASVNRSLQAELLSGGPSVKRTPPVFSMSHYAIFHGFHQSTR